MFSLVSTFLSYLPLIYISLPASLSPSWIKVGHKKTNIKWGNFTKNWNSFIYTVGWNIHFWIAISTKCHNAKCYICDTETPSPGIYPTVTQVYNICLTVALFVIERKKKKKVKAKYIMLQVYNGTCRSYLKWEMSLHVLTSRMPPMY